MLIILWDVKEPTHYSNNSRVIPVLWLSFVCERGVGEVGHLVRDLGVLLCPFPLGNKFCPVKWTKSKSKQAHKTTDTDTPTLENSRSFCTSLPTLSDPTNILTRANLANIPTTTLSGPSKSL